MALQASGAIKYSEIEAEFGRSFSAVGDNWTRVFGPAYDDSYFETFNDYNFGDGNYVKLPGTWNETFDGYSASEGNYVKKEPTYSTIYGPAYVAGQNYLKFFQGVFTVVYEGVEIGTLTTAYLIVGNRRYSGGMIAEDNGNTWQNPSYYEIKVEELVDTYNYYDGFSLVTSTTTPGETITVNLTHRYTMGSVNTGAGWTTIYGFAYVAGQNYLKFYQNVWTVVYEGVEIGTLTGSFLTVGNKRYSGGNIAEDNGNTWQNPSYYEIKVEEAPYYNIKIEEFGPDATNGSYTFYYGGSEIGTVLASDGDSIVFPSTFGNTRYRVGELKESWVTNNYYAVIVEKNPKSYVKYYQGVFTVVYEGIEYGQYTGAYLYVNQYRFSGGSLAVDNGNTWTNPSYYQLTVDQTETKWSLGNYRMDDGSTYGGIKMPLDYLAGALKDTDIPFKPDPIKFSNFYNARLNVIVDYYSNPLIPENRPENGVTRYTDPTRTTVVGKFLQRPVSTTGKAVRMVINKDIGCVNGVVEEDKNKCAIRTGSSWDTDTKLRVDVGPAGKIFGGGGNGGKGGKGDGSPSPDDYGTDGGPGTSGVGIEYEGTDNTMVSVTSGGAIVAGSGGGGGGGGARNERNEAFKDPVFHGHGGGGGGGAGLPVGEGNSVHTQGQDAPLSYSLTAVGGEGGEGTSGGNEVFGGDGGDGGGRTPSGITAATGGAAGDPDGGGGQVITPAGAAGAAGAAIRRTGGLTLTITNSGTIIGDQTATGVA
tara:strand:- start:837 stop:3101 length:2265 start_codon:yes stop_codon:yes gene_type:complete